SPSAREFWRTPAGGYTQPASGITRRAEGPLPEAGCHGRLGRPCTASPSLGGAAMPLYQCPTCRRSALVPSNKAVKAVTCPACGNRFDAAPVWMPNVSAWAAAGAFLVTAVTAFYFVRP